MATSTQNIPRPVQPQSGLRTSSTALEMSSLPSNDDMREAQPTEEKQSTDSMEARGARLNAGDLSRTEEHAQSFNSKLSAPVTTATPTRLTRLQSTAIGPSSDEPIPVLKDLEQTGPTLMMTLLLINGARHPFKLDAKYLNRRNVEVEGNDPFNLSVYKLKELILREWRQGPSISINETSRKGTNRSIEWEAKPSSPSSIRLISFGKLLDDNAPLSGKTPSNIFLREHVPPCQLSIFFPPSLPWPMWTQRVLRVQIQP